MGSLERLTLIATLTGVISGSWLGLSGPSPAVVPQADAIIGVGATMAADTLPSAVLASSLATESLATESLATDSPDAASAADGDEAISSPPPPRRGGGIGLNLKK